jgi:hypothetical protein
MPLSIDEADSRCTQTERGLREKDNGGRRKRKMVSREFPNIYGKFTKLPATRSGKKITKAKSAKYGENLTNKRRE